MPDDQFAFEVGSRVFATYEDERGAQEQTEARVVRRGRSEQGNVYEVTYYYRGKDVNLVRHENELEAFVISGPLGKFSNQEAKPKVKPRKFSLLATKGSDANASCTSCGARYYSASGRSTLCLECR